MNLINKNIVNKCLSIFLISVLIFPTGIFASDSSVNRDELKAHLESIKKQSKNKAHVAGNEQGINFTESYEKLQRGFDNNIFSSYKKQQTKEDLDSNLQNFISNYQKDEQVKMKRVNEVNSSEVNNRGIIVKMNQSQALETDKYNVTVLEVSKKLQAENIYLVKIPESSDYHKQLAKLRQDSNVLYAEPDIVQKSSFTPTDPQVGQQWYLEKIEMARAWDINKGSSDVTVAILDTGVNANHPDLMGRVLPGYDFVNNDTDAFDDNGHGTHIAGIIAANTNNIGGTGIDLNARILPVKVGDQNGMVSSIDSINGIYYAIDQGVDVINMSYGGYYYNEVVAEALWDAYNQGIVLVAAAGNDGTSDWFYPASYAPVISVAATDENDFPTYFTNYGGFIDITAPGQSIYSTNYLGGYGSSDGTSFSAPIVSALAGLVKSQHSDWKPYQIEWALQAGADQLDSTEWNYENGYGRVNGYGALTTNLPSLVNDVSDTMAGAKAVTSNTQFSDKVDLPMDTDWYSFEVTQSADVTIQMENLPRHIDLVGVAYKYSDGVVVGRQVIDDYGMGGTENLSFNAEPGSYYVAVYDYYSHWSQDSYNLKVAIDTESIDDPTLITEQEPNDYMYLADYLPFGSLGGGHFQTYEDYDFFEVDLPHSGDILITTATSNNATYNDPIAFLFDANGNMIGETDILWDSDSELKYAFELFDNINSGKYFVLMVNLHSYSDSNPYIFDISYRNVEGEIPIPIASIDSGTYTGAIDVALTSESGMEIRYTLDGSNPSVTNGLLYSSPLKIEKDTTLKAVSIENERSSEVVTYEYIINQIEIDPPSASVPSGDFTDSFEVELMTDLADAKIFYTLDESTPTKNNGRVYQGPIPIAGSTKIKAVTVQGELSSEVSTFSYKYIPKEMFPDTVGHWAQESINFLAEKGIIIGYPDGTFGPNDNIQRSAAAKIIVEDLGLPLQESNFTDVPSSHWASGYIGAASNAGIITGYQGKYNPNGFLTREEMAAILVRAYNLTGTSEDSFPDIPSGSWSSDYIEILVANGITNGLPGGNFGPKNNITRAEFCTMVARVLGFKAV